MVWAPAAQRRSLHLTQKAWQAGPGSSYAMMRGVGKQCTDNQQRWGRACLMTATAETSAGSPRAARRHLRAWQSQSRAQQSAAPETRRSAPPCSSEGLGTKATAVTLRRSKQLSGKRCYLKDTIFSGAGQKRNYRHPAAVRAAVKGHPLMYQKLLLQCNKRDTCLSGRRAQRRRHVPQAP